MISILIPIYNYDIRNLVKDLAAQLGSKSMAWEIRCYDDGSNPQWKQVNKAIAELNGVIYQELPQNIGRSAIRNLLATDAQYDYCLFLDNDSGIVRDDFVETYLSHLPSQGLIYGGRVYAQDPPQNPNHILHWAYGIKRESLTVSARKRQPHHAFMSNNFCIPRKVILDIGFEEQIQQYGHEDTLLGLTLAEKGIPVIHIDNPVVHLGLEINQEFLDKQAKAIQNLGIIRQKFPQFTTRLLSLYDKLKTWRLHRLVRICLKLCLPYIEKNLLGFKPSMRALDLWKLYRLLEHRP